MQIPDTPEALFEHLSDSNVREMFSNYDALRPRHRKLVHLLHTELTKGELSDASFMDTIVFITQLWRCFNRTACLQIEQLLDDNDELETRWINAALDYARVAQFIEACLNLYDAAPDFTELNGESTYRIHRTSPS
jgi:hypothetical protein